MILKNKLLLILFCITCFLYACTIEKEPENQSKIKEPIDDSKILIIYLAADNNLYSNSILNIEAILEGMEGRGKRVVIYHDTPSSSPRLMTVNVYSDECILDTLKVYEERNSSDPKVLNEVLKDVKMEYPNSKYGLFLWSHASAWIPSASPNIRSRSFGDDDNFGGDSSIPEMDIRDLALFLPCKFEYIVFDACLMSSVEVAYELKDKVKYLIASPTEIIADGFPYKEIMPYLFKGEDGLKTVCEKYFQYYHNQTPASQLNSGTITLLNTEKIDKLAQTVNAIIGDNDFSMWQKDNILLYPMANYESQLGYNCFYDLKDFMSKLANVEQMNVFNEVLNEVVLYTRATDYFWGKPLDYTHYSGLSVYIPLNYWNHDYNWGSHADRKPYEYYKNLKWAKIVYGY